MNLFDTHCHLTDERLLGDIEGVFSRMREAGVARAVVVGDASDDADVPAALELCEAREGLS